MFNISEFIRTNRAYFIWGMFLGLLYMFRNMFGLIFITFIMCFIASSISHKIRRKYHLNRRTIVISIYILFLMGVCAFLMFIPPRLLSETINFTEQLPKSMSSVRIWFNDNLSQNEIVALWQMFQLSLRLPFARRNISFVKIHVEVKSRLFAFINKPGDAHDCTACV